MRWISIKRFFLEVSFANEMIDLMTFETVCFILQEFELTLKEWTELQAEKISPCVTNAQAEVLTSLVQCLSIFVNW